MPPVSWIRKRTGIKTELKIQELTIKNTFSLNEIENSMLIYCGILKKIARIRRLIINNIPQTPSGDHIPFCF